MQARLTSGFYSSGSRQVWKGSKRGEVSFQPIARAELVKRYWTAIRLERRTRTTKNFQDGRLGRNAIAILHAFIFDCIDYATGRLTPSYEAIARAANISKRSVARGLAKLKAAGVVSWIRRCYWSRENGRLEQDSNAYTLLAPSAWPFEAARNLIATTAAAASSRRGDRAGAAGDRQEAPGSLSDALERATAARKAAGLELELAIAGELAPAPGRILAAEQEQTPAANRQRAATRARLEAARSREVDEGAAAILAAARALMRSR